MTCISWFSDFALYLEYYLLDKCHTWDISSLWPDYWHQNISLLVWPIFHGSVILPYILNICWINVTPGILVPCDPMKDHLLHCRSNTSRSVITRNPVYHESSVDPKFTTSQKEKQKKKKLIVCLLFYLIWNKKKKLTNLFCSWFFAHIQMRSLTTHYDQTIQLASISTCIYYNWQTINFNHCTCHNQCHNIEYIYPMLNQSTMSTCRLKKSKDK